VLVRALPFVSWTASKRPGVIVIAVAGAAAASTCRCVGVPLAGAADPKVAAVCQAEARVLFTLDLDFADIRTYPPGDYAGIVVLRPNEPTRRQVPGLVTRVLPARHRASHGDRTTTVLRHAATRRARRERARIFSATCALHGMIAAHGVLS
jgi:predicted nuclease of predicted toxin-antitoxin system